jgi:hypothetical protein
MRRVAELLRAGLNLRDRHAAGESGMPGNMLAAGMCRNLGECRAKCRRIAGQSIRSSRIPAVLSGRSAGWQFMMQRPSDRIVPAPRTRRTRRDPISPDYARPAAEGCRLGASSRLSKPIRLTLAPGAHRPLTPKWGGHGNGLFNGSARKMRNGSWRGSMQALAHAAIPTEMWPTR